MINHEAQKVLGGDFIPPEDIMSSMGIVYTKEEIALFWETIPSKEILEWGRANKYMLIAGPNKPMSLVDIYTMHKKRSFFRKEEKVEKRWYMIRKEVLSNSTCKNWSEQKALISEENEVPNAPQLAWAITMYKIIRGTCLFNGIYARTSSISNSRENIVIGNSIAYGLIIDSFEADFRYCNIGISVAQKII